MDLTEQKVYEALGVKPETPPPAEDGGKQPPAAPPMEQEQQTPPPAESGEKEQEPADPAKAEGKIPSGGPDGHPDPVGQGGEPGVPAEESGEKPGEMSPRGGRGIRKAAEPPTAAQSQEQRREAAAARRRAEQQAAIDDAVKKAIQEEKDRAKGEMAAFFKKAHLKNTLTGEDITNMEEFDAWEKAFSASKLQRELKEGKLTPESLEAAIAENQAVKRAQKLIRQQEEASKEAEASAAKARVDAELLEIQKLDPEIRSVEDLLHMPTAKEFYALVQKGNSFLDAFRLANYERLTARVAEAAKQQAQNLSRSKDHLTATTGQRGGGAISVPPDELRLFREINPGASEADIQTYYNQYKGQK